MNEHIFIIVHCTFDLKPYKNLQELAHNLHYNQSTVAHIIKATKGKVVHVNHDVVGLIFTTIEDALYFTSEIFNKHLRCAVGLHAGTLIRSHNPLLNQDNYIGAALNQGLALAQQTPLGKQSATHIVVEHCRNENLAHLFTNLVGTRLLDQDEFEVFTSSPWHDPTPTVQTTVHFQNKGTLQQRSLQCAITLETALSQLTTKNDMVVVDLIEQHKEFIFDTIDQTLSTHPKICARVLIALNEFCAAWRNHDSYQRAVSKLYQERDTLELLTQLQISFLYGRQSWRRGGVETVAPIFENILNRLEELDHPPSAFVIEVLLRLSTLARMQSHATQSRQYANRAFGMARQHNLTSQMSEGKLRLAMLEAEVMGNHDKSRQIFDEALVMARRAENPQVLMGVLIPLGEQEAPHHPEEALMYLQEALELSRQLMAPQYTSLIQLATAKIYVSLQQLELAEVEIQKAMDWSQHHNQLFLRCMAKLTRAKLHLINQNPLRALKVAKKALSLAEQHAMHLYDLDARTIEISANVLLRRHKRALEQAQECDDLFSDHIKEKTWQFSFIKATIALSSAIKHQGKRRQKNIDIVKGYLHNHPPNWGSLELYSCLWKQALASFPQFFEMIQDRTTLVIAADFTWFHLSGQSRVSLSRRPTLKRLLQQFSDNHFNTTTQGISVDDLFTIGWPEENIHTKSMGNRVYVAISELRRLGLADVLLNQGSGYLLEPTLIVIKSMS